MARVKIKTGRENRRIDPSHIVARVEIKTERETGRIESSTNIKCTRIGPRRSEG